jgi:hypothetical protein
MCPTPVLCPRVAWGAAEWRGSSAQIAKLLSRCDNLAVTNITLSSRGSGYTGRIPEVPPRPATRHGVLGTRRRPGGAAPGGAVRVPRGAPGPALSLSDFTPAVARRSRWSC